MKEQLVRVETAKLLQEKGFDLETDYFYCDNYKGLCDIGHDGEFLNIKGGSIYDCNGEFQEGNRYYTPTQALAQKWLREKHNIHIKIGFEGWYECHYKKPKGKKWVSGYKNRFPYDSYEEALENVLQESLKLIKTK